MLHVPTVMGAVVLTYNLPEVGTTKLQLRRADDRGHLHGPITKWNDKAIAKLNPGAKLPKSDIIVVHRSDGSGTSFIFTDFLSKVSSDWKDKVGKATSVNWPVGLGGKGNEGVTQQVKQTEGSIGYVELIYALANDLPYATVKNAAGEFVDASLASVTAAASSAKFDQNTDFRVSITNAPGKDAYPISSFTWLLVHPDMPDAAKAKAIRDFLKWMISPEAQGMATELKYAPLPKEVVTLIDARLPSLKANGKAIATE